MGHSIHLFAPFRLLYVLFILFTYQVVMIPSFSTLKKKTVYYVLCNYYHFNILVYLVYTADGVYLFFKIPRVVQVPERVSFSSLGAGAFSKNAQPRITHTAVLLAVTLKKCFA